MFGIPKSRDFTQYSRNPVTGEAYRVPKFVDTMSMLADQQETTPPGKRKMRRAIISSMDTGIAFELGDAYPNPCYSASTVAFTLFQPGYVRLELYSRKNRLLFTLIDRLMKSGEYKAFIVKELASLEPGEYYYQLQLHSNNGSERQRKRIVVL